MLSFLIHQPVCSCFSFEIPPAKITAYLHPAERFSHLDIQALRVVIQKLLQRKKKEREMQFFLLAPQKRLRAEVKVKFCFSTDIFGTNSHHITSLLLLDCMPMLNTSYFSNKLMVRIANRRLFPYTFYPCFLHATETLYREASTIKTRRLHQGSINIYEFTFFTANTKDSEIVL